VQEDAVQRGSVPYDVVHDTMLIPICSHAGARSFVAPTCRLTGRHVRLLSGQSKGQPQTRVPSPAGALTGPIVNCDDGEVEYAQRCPG